mmetsp:Transcript_123587/g.275922  ORF Transcript_123587/g.275922 Transcript_123587/m.275922 type:complete len:248 (-) Transcript_123587:271-1014(-)
MVSLAICCLNLVEIPCASSAWRAAAAAGPNTMPPGADRPAAADLRWSPSKTWANSWPRSRESTNASEVTANGAGKRTTSSPSAKLARNRRKWSASRSRSVCICTCSQKSSTARRTLSRRNASRRSPHTLKRRSQARSFSRHSRTPGLKHFTATAVPSPNSPKKTSAMLPLAWGRGSRERRSTSASRSEASTWFGEVPDDHEASTFWCMRPRALQTSSENRSRRVASHCASFTKQGPHRSICVATRDQ